ncbi:MAG: hypothetical protein GC150_07335 [Rhizobiales bacterium]|nr:hypothetical protein [Hyphomicrobiales bacterium]
MTAAPPDFLAIEIDELDLTLDARLAETARRKRIPSMSFAPPPGTDGADTTTGEELGGGAFDAVEATIVPTGRTSEKEPPPLPERRSSRNSRGDSSPEPAHRPLGEEDRRGDGQEEKARTVARRRPLSLEVPDYLARELKVKAATDAVTVRFLVLSALAKAGYRVDPDELEEDGRRLR